MDFSEFKRQLQIEEDKDSFHLEKEEKPFPQASFQEKEEKPFPQASFQEKEEKPFPQDSFQREKEEIQHQQIPQQSDDFDPEKFLKEKAGFAPKKPTDKCPDCNNTGIVKEANGEVHTCWKCLQEGKLDCHSESLPDNRHIRL